MAFLYTRAIKYSTPDILSKAYSEYMDHVADNYSKLLAGISDFVNTVDTNTDVNAEVDKTVAALNEIDGIQISNDTVFALNNGAYNFKGLLRAIGDGVKSKSNEIDFSAGAVNFNCPITIIDTDAKQSIVDLGDMLTEMNSTYHAVVVEAAAGSAMTLGKTVSEKISLFRDRVGETFSNAFSDVSNYMKMVTARLKSDINISQFIATTLAFAGINNTKETGESYDLSDASQYTGSCPSAAIATIAAANDFWQGAVNFFKTMAGIVYNIFDSAAALFEKGLGAVDNYLTEHLLNPYDVTLLDKNGNNTFANLYYLDELDVNYYPGSGGIDRHAVVDELSLGPVKYDFFGCEVVSKLKNDFNYKPFTDITTGFTWVAQNQAITLDVSNGLYDGLVTAYELDPEQFPDLLSISKHVAYNVGDNILGNLEAYHKRQTVVTIQTLVKAKPIDYRLLADIATPDDTGVDTYMYSPATIASILDKCAVTVNYPSIDESENNFYLDTIAGILVSRMIMFILALESKGIDPELVTVVDENYFEIPQNIEKVLFDQAHIVITDPITNKAFFDLLTEGVETLVTGGDYDLNDCPVINANWCDIITNVINYQVANPYDFAFWPYTHEYANWSQSKFALVTDAENQEALNTWLEHAIIIIVVAYLGYKAVKTFKRIILKATAELMGAEWNVTDAASRGALTNELLNTYKKKKFKLAILNLLSGNLVSVATDAYQKSRNVDIASYGNVDVDLTAITRLIAG